jgi:hypothetical protein
MKNSMRLAFPRPRERTVRLERDATYHRVQNVAKVHPAVASLMHHCLYRLFLMKCRKARYARRSALEEWSRGCGRRTARCHSSGNTGFRRLRQSN